MGIFNSSTGAMGEANNPPKDMYSTFTTKTNATTTLTPGDLASSLNLNVYDPTGNAGRTANGRGTLAIQGPWVNPHANVGNITVDEANNQYYKYNQMMMTYAQHFDEFAQRRELETPHWWFSRIPRGAYQLFNGVVQETRIYRGGLTTYAGLSQWEDINPYPDGTHDPCAPMKYDTYNYAWESLAWKGKKAGWGSDPICLDAFKFIDKATEQLGWILETGVRYGVDMQEVWNRDMFIYQSVQAGHSYLMTSEFEGVGGSCPRYVYQPFCKFGSAGADGVANNAYVDKPFIVFDASVTLEPLNFDVLDQVREYMKTMCPDAAVGNIGGEPMFALAVSHDDVERYIRANEEERRYWIEANPQALIQHYGFAPSTFRRWTITNDGNQLRFKLKKYIENYTASGSTTDTDDGEHPISYGNVGKEELAGKPVWIAEYVPPRIEGRTGINGSGVPTANPEYYKAEIAIAPVFMNKIFTNLFVPSINTLGSGTYFGPVTGLNGKWSWRNIVSWDKNPEGKIGNFYGTFEIVPKPDTCVFEATSFLYRRCVKALPSACPEQNAKVNPAKSSSAKVKDAVTVNYTKGKLMTAAITTVGQLTAEVGSEVEVKATPFTLGSSGALTVSGSSGTSYTAAISGGTLSVTSGSGDDIVTYVVKSASLANTTLTVVFNDGTANATDITGTNTVTAGTAADLTAYVVKADTPLKKTLQFVGRNVPVVIAAGADIAA